MNYLKQPKFPSVKANYTPIQAAKWGILGSTLFAQTPQKIYDEILRRNEGGPYYDTIRKARSKIYLAEANATGIEVPDYIHVSTRAASLTVNYNSTRSLMHYMVLAEYFPEYCDPVTTSAVDKCVALRVKKIWGIIEKFPTSQWNNPFYNEILTQHLLNHGVNRAMDRRTGEVLADYLDLVKTI